MEATKLQDGFYWIQLPRYWHNPGDINRPNGHEGPVIAEVRNGDDWYITGYNKEFEDFEDDVKVISERLDINDGQWKTAFEQASKSVDSAHELLDAVREIVTDYNAAQVDDDSEVFESLEAMEMISELIL